MFITYITYHIYNGLSLLSELKDMQPCYCSATLLLITVTRLKINANVSFFQDYMLAVECNFTVGIKDMLSYINKKGNFKLINLSYSDNMTNRVELGRVTQFLTLVYTCG